MRKDFKYILKATDLVMCTTQRGAIRLSKLTDENFDKATVLEELLLALEEEYIIVDNESTIDNWVEKINKELVDEEGLTTPITAEHVLEGIKNGWIGFKTVIWDEGIQIEKEEEIDVFRINIPSKEIIKFMRNNPIIYTKKDRCSVFKELIQYTANKNIKIEQLVGGDYISQKSRKKK